MRPPDSHRGRHPQQPVMTRFARQAHLGGRAIRPQTSPTSHRRPTYGTPTIHRSAVGHRRLRMRDWQPAQHPGPRTPNRTAADLARSGRPPRTPNRGVNDPLARTEVSAPSQLSGEVGQRSLNERGGEKLSRRSRTDAQTDRAEWAPPGRTQNPFRAGDAPAHRSDVDHVV